MTCTRGAAHRFAGSSRLPHPSVPRPAARTLRQRCRAPGHETADLAVEAADTAGFSGRTHEDVFVAAALRVQNLLSGAGDGEDELLESVVANEPPEAKLQTSAGVGGLVMLAAVVISSLCNQDPWGGMTPTASTLSWAAVGALAGLPLVGLRLVCWSRGTGKQFPVVEEMHRLQLQIVTPWFSRMNRGHVVAMMVFEVVPVLLLLLPAAQGVLSTWGGSLLNLLDPMPLSQTNDVALGQGAWEARDFLLHTAGLLLTAAIAAAGRGMELSPGEDEYEVIQTAMANADRYYRVMAMDVRNRGADADRAALAFKCVAQVWLETRSDASLLAAVLVFADVMYLGGLWYFTGNLAAPVVAALTSSYVDYHYLHEAVEEKLAKSSDSSSGRA